MSSPHFSINPQGSNFGRSRPLLENVMRRLILLRHAKTEPDAASGKDRDRRLDERGHEDAATIGGWLADHDLVPDLALVSTATRAQQTWTILKNKFRRPMRRRRSSTCRTSMAPVPP